MQKCQAITTPQMQPESLPGFTEKIVVALNDLALPGILKVVIKQQHLKYLDKAVGQYSASHLIVVQSHAHTGHCINPFLSSFLWPRLLNLVAFPLMIRFYSSHSCSKAQTCW